MNFLKITLLLSFLFGMHIQSNAQSLNLFDYQKKERHHTLFTAVLYDGKPIVKEDSPDGPLKLTSRTRGKITIAPIDRTSREVLQNPPIGFKIGIRDYQSNTLWMYSEKTFYEVRLEDILSKCQMGDQVIFMTVDRKYRLPRHEVVVSGDGC